ncbi:MAG TPA: pyridoxamine 5'-phosphate oxidase family protein [Ilumatobacteraceae bacterium]|nr:pyridoxamine 5'-phosphate oxidase family protein [Ilumatobacteraceae bacterium]HRB01751.1 pyridoxamine 5'-phosphate oxidase family protein [Ilumatobacteraceae bacterium]
MTTAPAHHDADATPKALEDLMPSGMCIAMVNTMVGRDHSSRPVTVADTIGSRLSFLVARNADWVTSIAASGALVHLTVANDAHSLYLSLNGTAIISQDTAEAARLWSKPAGVWFDGPDDPNLAVLHFDVSEGQYWDGPDGIVGRVVALARAAITSNDEALGSSGPVAT